MNRQPAGIPAGGEFAANSHDEAPVGLAQSESIHDEAARPLDHLELMEALSDPDRYSAHHYDTVDIVLRGADTDVDIPSERLNRDRPSFTDENEFQTALSRIDALWDKEDSYTVRGEKIVADMRRSGALSDGASSGREAYVRALVLSESGSIDEEQVNHLLDHIEEGGTDYRNHARAFGYHPEQFLSDMNSMSLAATYRSENASSDDVERAARARKGAIEDYARQFHARTDRGWTNIENDVQGLYGRVRALNELLGSDLSAGAKEPKVAAEISRNRTIDITAERDAYADLISSIETKWSAQS